MVVASGQMPYNYGTSIPLRNIEGGWPGLDTPNIGPSGNVAEAAMFVLNAELRKWGVDNLANLTYNIYTHPDVPPSGFEPKAGGETLTGLVGNAASPLSLDNIEQMRNSLFTLFSAYDNESNYSNLDFRESWFNSAYPESPSGSLVIFTTNSFSYSFRNATFLRPPLESVTGGDFVSTTDIHFLGGSGVIFDIDAGEVTFNPFPTFIRDRQLNPGNSDFRISFGPITPMVQKTDGTVPTINSSRLDDGAGSQFENETNFDAMSSGYVQFNGYCLVEGTVIELVTGDDNSYFNSVQNSSHYNSHIAGLRAVNNGIGSNDSTATCYRIPSPKAAGLYRLLAYNPKETVGVSSPVSGTVSLWPPGYTTQANDGALLRDNFTDGQQNSLTSDGYPVVDARDARGVHVFDESLWIASPSLVATPDNTTAGLYLLSPYTGEVVWYRPAEMTVSTAGDTGSPSGNFKNHVGLMDIGSDLVRLSLSLDYNFFPGPGPLPGDGVFTFYFQEYDKTTLDHNEVGVTFTFTNDDQPARTTYDSVITNGSDIFLSVDLGNEILRFDTSYNFTGFFRQPNTLPSCRRHYAGGDLLYTTTSNPGAFVSDPLKTISGGATSGIGKWNITGEPGSTTTDIGSFSHVSAKPLRAETFVGNFNFAAISTIFDISGSSNFTNGIWMIVQFSNSVFFLGSSEVFLLRIVEGSSEWQAVEGYKLDQFTLITAAGGGEFPTEAVYMSVD